MTLSRSQPCTMLVLFGAIWSLGGCAARNTGPWDLPSLQKTPEVEWVDATGELRSLYYANEPYQGKPTRVFACYAVPEDTSKKVPGMVLVHGGGGQAYPAWAKMWAKRGYATIAMDLAGNGPGKKRMPDGGPDQQLTQKFAHIERGVKEAWAYHAIAAVIRAHSLLRSLPEVDAERVGITGVSWGGYLTCLAAGLDDRFKVAVPVYGCGFLHENSVYLKCLAKLSSDARQLWIDNYDPSQYLPQCRMPMLFINGTNDFAFAMDSHQKSYQTVRGPRALRVTVRMPHGQGPGSQTKAIRIFIDAVLRGGTPLTEIKDVSRQGNQVTVTFASEVPVKKAALHYTTDGGIWKKRQWHTVPAHVNVERATATLPTDKGVMYLLTLTDERGAIVSTEYEEIGPLASQPAS